MNSAVPTPCIKGLTLSNGQGVPRENAVLFGLNTGEFTTGCSDSRGITAPLEAPLPRTRSADLPRSPGLNAFLSSADFHLRKPSICDQNIIFRSTGE